VACAVEKRPFTVAGQWRLFTALPEHLASELLFARQLQIKLLSSCPRVHAFGLTADAMKLMRIESKGKPDGSASEQIDEEAQPVIRETRRIVRSNSGIVIDLSFEVDANRRELSRSPGSRFFGWKLPSQRWLRQWLTRFAPPRLQWRGRSGLAPDSHTKPSRTIYTASG
jgi:hypothetical protein